MSGLTGSKTTVAVVLTLLAVLILVSAALTFFLVRARRRARAATDPEKAFGSANSTKKTSNHRRLTVSPTVLCCRSSNSIYEKQDLLAHETSPPTSPLPEIRITFPDELDNAGKRKSGRVVVVRVGDHTLGLEPVSNELPPYERDESCRFESLDLDRIGGLKEKEALEY